MLETKRNPWVLKTENHFIAENILKWNSSAIQRVTVRTYYHMSVDDPATVVTVLQSVDLKQMELPMSTACQSLHILLSQSHCCSILNKDINISSIWWKIISTDLLWRRVDDKLEIPYNDISDRRALTKQQKYVSQITLHLRIYCLNT